MNPELYHVIEISSNPHIQELIANTIASNIAISNNCFWAMIGGIVIFLIILSLIYKLEYLFLDDFVPPFLALIGIEIFITCLVWITKSDVCDYASVVRGMNVNLMANGILLK